MKMKRMLVLALLVVAAAVGSYLLASERGDLEGLALTDPKDVAVKPTVANPVERLESQNRVAVRGFLQKLDQSIQETRSRQAVLGEPDDGAKTREPMLEKDMAQVFASTFPEIKKVGTMVNRDELRAAILDRLLAQPGYVRMASDILADWHKAQELFGEEQAYARVSALRMLRRAAGTGNAEPLADALRRLGQRLNTDAPWEKGVEHDYVAMVADYVNYVGVDAFLEDPQPVLALAGLTKKTSDEISKGIFDSKARAVSPEILRSRLLPYFQFQ